ncbi:hypothetical protein KL86DPRO_20527 [uncultured delta proteobacterium]|uniref:Uncharacterized protein n=1 Tax=uncultured delta proteobacterium TaxID=34034 RepID=A0A212K1W9_9DELT|nr:hypothetical protein KL86DPRO_20527 [uncultured delta proteobacterium]
MGKKKDIRKAVEADSAEQHMALAEELNKLAELHLEMAELKEEQQNLVVYKEFCDLRNIIKAAADVYEENGDMLRAEAIRRSVPIAPELLDYLKRTHDQQYFEEVILGQSNIYEALLVYGPKWLEYDESQRIRPEEKVLAG